MDTIPTHHPDASLRHSTLVRDLTNDQLYNYEDSIWKRVTNETEIVYAIDSVQQLASMDSFVNFKLGDRIINRSTGANYLVQADSVAGYANDTVAVIPVDVAYAVLQSINGQYDVRWFGAVGDSITNDAAAIQAGLNFINLNPSTLFLSEGDFITDTTLYIGQGTLRGVISDFTQVSGSELRYRGLNSSSIIESLNDAGEYGSYIEGQSIVDLSIWADSAVSVGINLLNPSGTGSGGLSNIRINGTNKKLTTGVSVDFSINYNLNGVRIDQCEVGVRFVKSGSASTTTSLINSYVTLCDTGVVLNENSVLDLLIVNSIIESADSSGIFSYGGNRVYVDNLYTENIEQDIFTIGVNSADHFKIINSSISGANGSPLSNSVFNINFCESFSVLNSFIARSDTLLLATTNSEALSISDCELQTVTINGVNNELPLMYKLQLRNVKDISSGLERNSVGELDLFGGTGSTSYPSWSVRNGNSFGQGELAFQQSTIDYPSIFLDAKGNIQLFGKENPGLSDTSDHLILLHKGDNVTLTGIDQNESVILYPRDDGSGGAELTGQASRFRFIADMRVDNDVTFDSNLDVALESRLGGIIDQGAYNLQVEGHAYFDDNLIVQNGEALLGGITDQGSYKLQVGGRIFANTVLSPGLIMTNTLTDAQNKALGIASLHYTNAEEQFQSFGSESTSTNNTVSIGGGAVGFNAATEIQFHTAANNTTLIGTQRMSIETDGEVLIGTTDNGAYTFQVNGNSYYDGGLSLAGATSGTTEIVATAVAGTTTATLQAVTGTIALLGDLAVTATESAEGIVELATVAELDAGTDVSRVPNVDNLAGSDFGTKDLQIEMFAANVAVSTGDGNFAVTIPASLDGYDLVNAVASVHDKGITGTTDITIERWRAGAAVDMLSTAITIGDEWFAQDGAIDAANDDVLTGDRIYINPDVIHSGTAPNGLSVVLEFRKP
jgi:hypothetical protein